MKISFLIIFILFAMNSEAGIIRTHESGFYSIDKNDLTLAGLNPSQVKLGQLKIEGNQGNVPYFFKSKKKKLKDEDSIIFFAPQLKGEHFQQHLHDDFNGFTFEFSKKPQRTKDWIGKSRSHKKWPQCESLRTSDHYEKNKLLIRVNTREYQEAPELWYWHKITQLNKKGVSINLDTDHYANFSDVKINAVFRSTNIDRSARDIEHHQINVLVNGQVVKELKWNGKKQLIANDISIPAEFFKTKDNQVTFFVPKRLAGKKSIIDIIMLDYFDLSYNIPASNIQPHMSLSSDIECQQPLKSDQFAYSIDSSQYSFDSVGVTPSSNIHISSLGQLKTANLSPKSPMDTELSKIEYLVISHENFIESMQPFIDHYKDQGVNIRIVDVNKIYQHYSHGVRELYAIKNFIKDVFDTGNGVLEHVLLVGDSSWDWRDNGKTNKYGNWASRILPKNRNFTNFPHQRYQDNIDNRDFVPTGQYHSYEGHSASDNWFVSFIPEKEMNQTEDYIPDLAIGRFPASNKQEVQSMVNKTINYSKNSKVGPWKSRVLWITNAEKRFQNSSLRNSDVVGEYGVMADKIFPPEMDGDNIKIQNDLSTAFDQGELIVHFLGHGGKSIWRVGPPDLKKNRDLFTLDHITNLKNSSTLPFVMSMSCYSAPFDHPLADSIGEKFIREPDVGAVAVLAASWRNSPNSTFSRYILEELYKKPRQTLGNAILNAKRKYKGRTMVEMYNLLGDPALQLAVPQLAIDTNLTSDHANLTIDAEQFEGKAIVEFLDDKSNSLKKMELDVRGPQFTIPVHEVCKQARVYAWDESQNIDAMGSFKCPIDNSSAP